ncbi:hypothetical protein [Spirosoma koreense]
MQTISDFLTLNAPYGYTALVAILLGFAGVMIIDQLWPDPKLLSTCPRPMSQTEQVQHILATGQLDESTETPVLEAAQATLCILIRDFSGPGWGPVGLSAHARYVAIADRVQLILNSRRGSDGITPITV